VDPIELIVDVALDRVARRDVDGGQQRPDQERDRSEGQEGALAQDREEAAEELGQGGYRAPALAAAAPERGK
jgi:general stress protein YciG